jgi:hypothetical protein
MTRVTGLMATTVWIPASATGSRNRTRSQIAQPGDLQLNGSAAGFQVSERVGHVR